MSSPDRGKFIQVSIFSFCIFVHPT